MPVLHYLRAGRLHLFDRALAITGFDLNRAHRIFQGLNLKALFHGVKHRILNAVVCCESTDYCVEYGA